jgi:superfamily II DNA or RNA helicase
MTARDCRTVIVRGGVADLPIGPLVSREEAREDSRALSVLNPKRIAAIRQKDRRAFRHPERVSSLVIEADRVLYPIGAASVYRARLRGKRYDLVDERVRMPRTAVAEYDGRLFDYQARSVEALASVTGGVCVAECGAGKTEILAGLVGLLGCTTLILAGQLEQCVDLRERLPRRLGIPVGMVGGGEHVIERVTVALVQALDDATVEKLAPLFEVVIRDEVHHAAAEGELALWRRLQARRFYGFTATPRTDGLQPLVHAFFGPVVAQVTRDELIAAGRAVDPEIREVATTFTAPYDGPKDWARLLADVEKDTERNALIVDTVAREGVGEVSAVLTGRIEHADVIGAQLRARGLRVEVLSSKRTKKDRAAVILAARDRAVDVIVGTQILDEGVDVAPLSRVFMVWPSKAEGRLVQRIGRALRPLPGKSRPVAFDFVDARVGVLRHQARQRRAVYAKHWPSTLPRCA